jgi:hypothetical protein
MLFAAAIVFLWQYDLYLIETEKYTRLINTYERILFAGPLNLNTANEQQLASLIEQTDEQINAASSKVALKASNEKFIDDLRRIAQNFDVNFEVKNITSSSKDFFVESRVTFVLKGPAPGLSKTINQINNLERLISWQEAGFSVSSYTANSNKLLRAKIAIYTLAKRHQISNYGLKPCEIKHSELWLPPFSIWSAELSDQAYEMCQKQFENQRIATMLQEYEAKQSLYKILTRVIEILGQHRKTFEEASAEAITDE